MEREAESKTERAALYYASHGLAVFPLKEKSKEPATAHGVKDATTDPEIIKEWYKINPAFNVAIATGKVSGGLFVVDLDQDDEKGKDGTGELKKWERESGHKLPDTANTITGRGGYHLLYKESEALKEVYNHTNILPGVDIRGEGGYIVAPPSVHPNGNAYQWEQTPADYGITPADANLKALFEDTNAAAPGTFEAPEAIQEGGRNDTLYRAACSLRKKGFAEKAILAAIEAENAAACIPPLSQKEIESIVKSALKREPGELQPAAEPVKQLTPEERQEQKGAWLDAFVSEIQTEKYKPVKTGEPFFDELINGGFEIQTVTLLQGQTGAGKSILAEQLAESIARSGQEVIYLNFEMSPEELTARAISARLAKRHNIKMTAKDLKHGYKWTDKERAEILKVFEEYKRESLPYISYNPDDLPPELPRISGYLEELLKEKDEQGKDRAPVLFLDYLQIVDGPQDIKENLKTCMRKLKHYAMKGNTFVVVLSAVARNANPLTIGASRDSSNNEYNSDIVIGLADYKEQAATQGRQRMKLKIIKGRADSANRFSIVYRDGANSIFTGEYKGEYDDTEPDPGELPEWLARPESMEDLNEENQEQINF